MGNKAAKGGGTVPASPEDGPPAPREAFQDDGNSRGNDGAASFIGVSSPKSFGATEDVGFGQEESDMQDARCHLRCHDGFLLALFDGTGPAGRAIALKCAELLPTKFESHSSAAINPAKALSESLEAIHEALVNDEALDTSMSGVQATACFLKGSTIFAALVGTLRAVICSKDAAGDFTALDVLTPHYPDSKGERERLEKSGLAVVKQWELDNVGTVTRPCIWWGGTHAKAGERGPGLESARYLGWSGAAELGVMHTASVCELAIAEEAVFLVLASSGCWKCTEIVEAARTGGRTNCAKVAADQIVKLACDKWEMQFVSENVTAIVVFLRGVSSDGKVGDPVPPID